MAAHDPEDTKRDATSATSGEKTAESTAPEGATNVMVDDAIPVAAGAPATSVAASVEPPRGKLLNREDAAEILGISPTTFRRRYEDIVVAPIMENGVHRFLEVTIREIAIRERRERLLAGDVAMDVDRGKLTAVVFDLLDQGVGPIEIVKRLERPAPEIEELHAQWARMRGTVVLSGDQVEKLRSLDWTGSKAPPIESGEKLVRFIQDLNTVYGVDAKNCEGCHATRARICVACARIQVERIKAENRRQAEEERAQTRRYVEDAKTQRAHFAAIRGPTPAPRRRTASLSAEEARAGNPQPGAPSRTRRR